jgi:F-type H+-transporting ATPase subunit b
MRSISGNFGFVFLLLACFSLGSAALQQSQPGSQKRPAAPSSSSGSSAAAAFAPESANANQEVVHAANEAAGRTPQEAANGKHGEAEGEAKDEEAAFKYSAAVRGIARITGLSLTTAYWVCVVINFLIIAVLVLLAMKSNVPAMLRGRTQEIQKGIEDARHASEDAGRRLREVEARLSRLSSEIEDMQKHAEADARAEEDRIRASIDAEKHKILQAAEQEITQTVGTVRRDLQKYAAELAVAFAEKGIRVDANSDKALVEDFTEQLGADVRRNGGN